MKQYKKNNTEKKHAQHYHLSDYVNTILDETGIDIRVKSRLKEQQDLQKIFCRYVCWTLGYSLTYVGNYINRTHASIKNSVDKYDDLYITDAVFRQKADHYLGRFDSIDAREDTQVIKKALIDLINVTSEKDRARIYAVAVDILEGKQTVSITKDQIIKIIDKQASKLILTDE